MTPEQAALANAVALLGNLIAHWEQLAVDAAARGGSISFSTEDCKHFAQTLRSDRDALAANLSVPEERTNENS